jgi:hypothetical protein
MTYAPATKHDMLPVVNINVMCTNRKQFRFIISHRKQHQINKWSKTGNKANSRNIQNNRIVQNTCAHFILITTTKKLITDTTWHKLGLIQSAHHYTSAVSVLVSNTAGRLFHNQFLMIPFIRSRLSVRHCVHTHVLCTLRAFPIFYTFRKRQVRLPIF